jgi:hypothetical protein
MKITFFWGIASGRWYIKLNLIRNSRFVHFTHVRRLLLNQDIYEIGMKFGTHGGMNKSAYTAFYVHCDGHNLRDGVVYWTIVLKCTLGK